MLKTFILILTHSKSEFMNLHREKFMRDNKDRFIFFYFIGDLSLDSDYKIDLDNNIIYLKVPDNYESLSLKVYNGIKFIVDNYEVSGIFKTDDDIDLDLDKIESHINENYKCGYFGNVNETTHYESEHHFGKCESEELNSKRVFVPASTYCSGGGYYLSIDNAKMILNNREIFYTHIYEDMCVGLALNENNIFPKHIDIKNNGCIWE